MTKADLYEMFISPLTDDNAMDRLDYIVVSISSDNTAENIQAVMTQAYS